MMSSNSIIGEELKFQQRWAFRRGDIELDSSSNDSKSSFGGETAQKKHKLFSSLVPVDNDDTSEATIIQQKANNEPRISGQTELRKTEKGKRGRTKKESLVHNEKKRSFSSNREVSKKKGIINDNERAALDDLENYMNSLLEELKVSRKNLLLWMREEMQKLVEEEKAHASERKGVDAERVQLKCQNNLKENAQAQCENLFGKNIQVPHQTNSEEHGQVQKQSKVEENGRMQHLINLGVNIGVQPQEKVQLQRQKRIRSCTGDRTCNGRPSKRVGKSKKSVYSNNYTPALEDAVDYSRAIVLLTPPEEDREEVLALSDKYNSKSTPSNKNVQEQQQKSIVLAIRAQTCNNQSPVKSVKGKKSFNYNNRCQVPEYQVNYNEAMGSTTSAEKNKEERSGLSIEPNFPFDSFSQAASSMYLTLPSVLTNPHVASQRPNNTFPFSYLQPRIAQNQTSISSERSNAIMGSSSHLGYFQGMQPKERSGNYTQLRSRDVSFFNQNSSTSSIVGSGFTVPLQAINSGISIPNQFDLENLPRENNNTLGLTVNGGALRFSGAGYSLPEPHLANNFHSHPNYRADGRRITYQDGYRFPN